MSQIGFGSNNGVGRKLITLNIKDLPPLFELKEKVDDSWKSVDKTNEIAGYLQNVQIITKSSEKYGETKQIALDMDLGDFLARIYVNLNSVGKEILNRMSKCDDLKGSVLKMRVYVDKKNYPSIVCYKNDEIMEWGLTSDQVKLNFAQEGFWVSLYETKIRPQFDSTVVTEEAASDLDDFMKNVKL